MAACSECLCSGGRFGLEMGEESQKNKRQAMRAKRHDWRKTLQSFFLKRLCSGIWLIFRYTEISMFAGIIV